MLRSNESRLLLLPADAEYCTADQPDGEEAWINCEDTIAAKTLESGIEIQWTDDPTWAVVAPKGA